VARAFDLGEYGRVTSVVVLKNGELAHEQYADGDSSTLRNTRSCTKTVLTFVVGAAIEQGLISGVDVEIGELLDARQSLYPDPRKAKTTIRDLLTMSSCLECDDWNPYSAGNEERMYLREDWVQFALDLPVRGSRDFSYCTAGVVLLGVAVARALGESLSSFAAREIFPAAGIDAFEWPTTPLGDDSAAGGLCLSARSLAELAALYVEGGRGAVTGDWIEESTRPQRDIDERTQYGYLWWLRDYEGRRSYCMAGAGGSRVHGFPELGLSVAITSENFGVPDAHDLTERLVVERVLDRFG
jgi:CubicO group peptidase (beta-lactamase class C family)